MSELKNNNNNDDDNEDDDDDDEKASEREMYTKEGVFGCVVSEIMIRREKKKDNTKK